jgi:cysteine desulfurase
MATSPAWTADLHSILEDHEIIQPHSQLYQEETKTWAAQRNLSPKVLLRPRSVERLARALAYLNDTELDFAVRSGGVGSSSAKDVLISLGAFDGFEHEPAAGTITVGAGQTWGEVDQKLEQAASGYAGEEAGLPSDY